MLAQFRYFLGAALLAALPLFAQTSGTIVGRVTDPAKAAVSSRPDRIEE